MKVGWKTWSAFALVLAAGIAVFGFLPRWVNEHPVRSVADAPPRTIAAQAMAETPTEPEEAASPPPSSTAPAALPAAEASTPAPGDTAREAFTSAMTEALSALKNEDYEVAREAFERARTLRPESPDVASGLSQVEEGLRTRAIAGHRDRGFEQERLESWAAAEREYASALALDSSLRFAQEGKKRTGARAILAERLEFQIAHPDRLSDERALEEATRLLDEARGVEPAGPRQLEAIAKLEALVASFSRSAELQILSDTLTDVTVRRVGRLGKFDRRVLSVRPGRYVLVGTRAGFRDVRIELVVEPGKPPAPVVVRCEEAI